MKELILSADKAGNFLQVWEAFPTTKFYAQSYKHEDPTAHEFVVVKGMADNQPTVILYTDESLVMSSSGAETHEYTGERLLSLLHPALSLLIRFDSGALPVSKEDIAVIKTINKPQ